MPDRKGVVGRLSAAITAEFRRRLTVVIVEVTAASLRCLPPTEFRKHI